MIGIKIKWVWFLRLFKSVWIINFKGLIWYFKIFIFLKNDFELGLKEINRLDF